jgi:hypothetical protein
MPCLFCCSFHLTKAFILTFFGMKNLLLLLAGTIWLAPSSLLGHPGYGLFTTRNLTAGEPVLGGPDGLSIPVEDRWYEVSGELGEKKKNWIHLWNSYWWGRGVPDHVSYESSHSSADYQIGFGAMPNHHCILRSLKHRYPETAPYQDSLVNRFKDPGAGAFSYSRGREFTVIRDVPAGGELFLNYGVSEIIIYFVVSIV